MQRAEDRRLRVREVLAEQSSPRFDPHRVQISWDSSLVVPRAPDRTEISAGRLVSAITRSHPRSPCVSFACVPTGQHDADVHDAAVFPVCGPGRAHSPSPRAGEAAAAPTQRGIRLQSLVKSGSRHGMRCQKRTWWHAQASFSEVAGQTHMRWLRVVLSDLNGNPLRRFAITCMHGSIGS